MPPDGLCEFCGQASHLQDTPLPDTHSFRFDPVAAGIPGLQVIHCDQNTRRWQEERQCSIGASSSHDVQRTSIASAGIRKAMLNVGLSESPLQSGCLPAVRYGRDHEHMSVLAMVHYMRQPELRLHTYNVATNSPKLVTRPGYPNLQVDQGIGTLRAEAVAHMHTSPDVLLREGPDAQFPGGYWYGETKCPYNTSNHALTAYEYLYGCEDGSGKESDGNPAYVQQLHHAHTIVALAGTAGQAAPRLRCLFWTWTPKFDEHHPYGTVSVLEIMPDAVAWAREALPRLQAFASHYVLPMERLIRGLPVSDGRQWDQLREKIGRLRDAKATACAGPKVASCSSCGQPRLCTCGCSGPEPCTCPCSVGCGRLLEHPAGCACLDQHLAGAGLQTPGGSVAVALSRLLPPKRGRQRVAAAAATPPAVSLSGMLPGVALPPRKPLPAAAAAAPAPPAAAAATRRRFKPNAQQSELVTDYLERESPVLCTAVAGKDFDPAAADLAQLVGQMERLREQGAVACTEKHVRAMIKQRLLKQDQQADGETGGDAPRRPVGRPRRQTTVNVVAQISVAAADKPGVTCCSMQQRRAGPPAGLLRGAASPAGSSAVYAIGASRPDRQGSLRLWGRAPVAPLCGVWSGQRARVLQGARWSF